MDLPQPWGAYARIQGQLDSLDTVDDRAWGLEAGLNRLLDGIPPETTDRVIRSESRKERYRARLRRVNIAPPYSIENELSQHARELLVLLLKMVSASDRALLL